MTIFSPDFTTVDASIPIYDKGRYRLLVTKKKPAPRSNATRKAERDPESLSELKKLYNFMTQNDLDNGRMICLIGVAAFSIHAWFLKICRPEFNTPVSKLILWGTLIVALVQAWITISLLGKGY